MIVWRLGGKIIRTVLCCILYNSCAQWYAHTCEQFLNLCVGLGLDFVFVCLFRFTICVFCVSSDQFIPVLLAFVVLGLVFLVPTKVRDWVGRTSPKWLILWLSQSERNLLRLLENDFFHLNAFSVMHWKLWRRICCYFVEYIRYQLIFWSA